MSTKCCLLWKKHGADVIYCLIKISDVINAEQVLLSAVLTACKPPFMLSLKNTVANHSQIEECQTSCIQYCMVIKYAVIKIPISCCKTQSALLTSAAATPVGSHPRLLSVIRCLLFLPYTQQEEEESYLHGILGTITFSV